jgi:hypothetical protein
VQKGHQIPAVVQDEIGLAERAHFKSSVLFGGASTPAGENFKAVRREGRQISTWVDKGLHPSRRPGRRRFANRRKIGRFCFEVNGKGYDKPREGLFFFEIVLNRGHTGI